MKHTHPPVVQISLDLINLEEAINTAEIAVNAGVDWLEAGTPLLLAKGLHCVEALRERFKKVPIVADLKTMDGGYLEAEMMAKAGASMVVVMGRAHEATVRAVIKAAEEHGIKVFGDDLACEDKVNISKKLEELGCDFICHHIGYDERRLVKGISPLDELDAIVEAVNIPVQAVGGLSIEQAVECPKRGAPLVVIGAPLAIDPSAFRTTSADLGSILRKICEKVHGS